MMENRIKCDFTEISEEQRLADLEAALQRGNHKLVSSRQDLLEELVQDDINSGFQVLIPINSLKLIKGGYLLPYGIADQSSINERRERIEKNWITHD